MSRTLALCVAMALTAGCKGKTETPPANPTPPPAPAAADAAAAAAPPAATTPTTSPSERAKQLLDAQVDAIKTGTNDKLVATLDPSAVVMAPFSYDAKQADLVKLVGSINPHDTIKDIKIARSTAGGTADVVWVAAELAITKLVQEPETKEETRTDTVRVSELLTAASGWKVVAAGFAMPQDLRRKKDTVAMTGANAAGPLAKLLASPDQVAGALATDPAVAAISVGDKDFAVGADDAKKLLATLKDKKITVSSAREVHDPKWGVVQAMLDAESGKPNPYRFAGQLFALPRPDGSWQVVAVQYIGL